VSTPTRFAFASLDEVARYTKAADQARLARNAMTKAVIR
jgi:hypothetical protein